MAESGIRFYPWYSLRVLFPQRQEALFNVKVVKNGIRRVVNNFPDSPRSLWALR
jgi:hypothetical protein